MKKNEHTFEPSKEELKELLQGLIKKFKEEWVAAVVQEHIYMEEFHNPKHITKGKAQEAMGTYQTRIKYLEENITAVEYYAKHKKIIL